MSLLTRRTKHIQIEKLGVPFSSLVIPNSSTKIANGWLKRSPYQPTKLLLLIVVGNFLSLVALYAFQNSNLIQIQPVSKPNPIPCLSTIPEHLRSSFQVCERLGWKEPESQKLSLGKGTSPAQPNADADIQSLIDGMDQIENRFHLVVHYVYHESGSETVAAKQNKRVNLEFFLQEAVLKAPSSVEFHFSCTGYVPSAKEYFEMLGSSQVLHRDLIFPTGNKNVHLSFGPSSTTDLCQHGRWLGTTNLTMGPGSYLLFINDGVRGPFVTNQYAKKVLQHSFITEKGIPEWFLPFLAKFSNNNDLAMVGPALSSEISTHLQSYAIALRLISESFIAQISQPLLKACDMEKLDAISEGEIGLSKSILKQGFSLASFFPNTLNITVWDDMCMSLGRWMNGWANSNLHACFEKEENIISKVHDPKLLGRPKNPTFFFSGPASHVVFAKYGGEVLRENMIPLQLQMDVLVSTRKVLGNHTWEPL